VSPPNAPAVLSGILPDQTRSAPGCPPCPGAERLYHSPVGLFGFQLEGVARAVWQYTGSEHPATFVTWDTGIGKTHLTMASAALMFEDGTLDHLIVVAEANKIKDWAHEDLPTFTGLSTALYAGSPDRRRRILEDMPQALVMTFETGRNDICTFKARSKAITGDKMLTTALLGKRVMVVLDETSAKLRNRNSGLYIAWDYLLNRRLRRDKATTLYVSAMTATPVEKSPEDHFNVGRLIAPELAPTVAQFKEHYIGAYDIFGNPSKFVNLTTQDCAPGVVPFNQVFAPITMRKRKTDRDVIEQFPAKVENPPRFIDLDPRHQDFYEAVHEALASSEDLSDRAVFTLMRQIAANPLALTYSKATTSKTIVQAVGHAGLAALGAAKVEAMLAWQQQMGDQQTVIFTFFGQSVLPLLQTALAQQGYAVEVNHGQMSHTERFAAQGRFKAGDAQIFLSSDAGARGLNLGVGSGLLHYELPVMYSTFVQRSDRIHRIDSKSRYGHESITIDSLVARHTVEERIADLLLKRNGWSDQVLDDGAYSDEDWDPGEQFLTATDRRAMLALARRAAA
jgi:hypothetical protein